MTRLFNDPAAFADEMIDGFVAANRRWVRRVPGGVIRAAGTPRGQVAVVIGGGSGHYPAFGGLVGTGLAHGAAMGAVFASPSTQQVYSVASAAHAGGGVLLTYGNYAGDVLNFDLAQERLRNDGIDVQTVVVTDDICSAPMDRAADRRGIAGDFTVFKVACAAADEGMSLSDVTRIALHANTRTRSMGVAFSGCTLPGAESPLFDVTDGRMAVGLGIHGEPGIDEMDLPSADALAELLVDRVVAETPSGSTNSEGQRVAVILNGLGAVKYEELFVVYRRVADLLAQRGLAVVEPEVGELCTSLDMAGVSLTILWLDDELEFLWRSPANAPAFTKVGFAGDDLPAELATTTSAQAECVTESTPDSRALSQVLVRAIGIAKMAIDDCADQLGRLDAIAGDGDHGTGMQRGLNAALTAASDAASDAAGAHTVLKAAGAAWADRAGGTSGALWGAMLSAAAEWLRDDEGADKHIAVSAVSDAAAAVQALGQAQVGDKTMVDAVVPFAATLLDAIDGHDASLSVAWSAAAAEASRTADGTAALVPRRGRARIHTDRSVGSADPGAISFAVIVGAVGSALRDGADTTGAQDAGYGLIS